MDRHRDLAATDRQRHSGQAADVPGVVRVSSRWARLLVGDIRTTHLFGASAFAIGARAEQPAQDAARAANRHNPV
jgi:hypothetical protein